MRIHRHCADVDPRPDRVVAYSALEGLHLGHQRLLDELAKHAVERRAFLLDERAIGRPRLVSRRRCLEELIAREVADVLVLTAAESSLDEGLRVFSPQALLVSGGEARPAALGALAVIREVAGVEVGGEPVTAARLRAAVAAAEVGAAAAMLGRPYAVDGRVVHGFHRGAGIGVPTANLRIGGLQLPPDGVYAVTARTADHVGIGVANLGTNPTFGNRDRSLETHIFDFDGDIYGARLEVGFVARLRGERKFDGVDALVAQIRSDIEAARAIHRSR